MALKYSYHITRTLYPAESFPDEVSLNGYVEYKNITIDLPIGYIHTYHNIKRIFLPYYIQEIEKIIDGSREKPLTIDIDPNLDYCIGTIEVHKEKAYASIDDYGNIEIDNPQTQTIETDQLLELMWWL
jgi:hypothetical protein